MTRKPSKLEGGARGKLSQSFVTVLEADFQTHGATVIERLREKHPDRYAELVGRLIVAVEPAPADGSFASCQSMQDIGRRLLEQVGLAEPSQDEIQEAVEANNTFVATLENIRNRAMQ
jgi:hypothetical protein